MTVVLSSNASDTRLNPRQLVEAITQTPFLIYAGIYIGGVVILAGLSPGRLGRTYVFIDVGLCALFGGFTVLSTKALSTLITWKWYGIFAEWITYPLILVSPPNSRDGYYGHLTSIFLDTFGHWGWTNQVSKPSFDALRWQGVLVRLSCFHPVFMLSCLGRNPHSVRVLYAVSDHRQCNIVRRLQKGRFP